MTIKPGIYEHYKGGRYRVIDVARPILFYWQ